MGSRARQAIYQGDAASVRRALASGADVLAPIDGSRGLLEEALLNGTELIFSLVLRRLRVTANDPQLSRVISAAVTAHSSPERSGRAIRLLERCGVDYPEDCNGGTALMRASYYGYEDLVAELIKAGALVNHRNTLGETALTYAAAGSNHGCVRRLLAAGALVVDPRDEGPDGEYSSALVSAVYAGPITPEDYANAKEVMKLLLDYSPPLDRRDKLEKIPLYWACYFFHPCAIEMLVERGAATPDQAFATYQQVQAELKETGLEDTWEERRDFWHRLLLKDYPLPVSASPRPRI